MDDVSPEPTAPVTLPSDVIGGVLFWLIVWWLWAREKSRAKQTWK